MFLCIFLWPSPRHTFCLFAQNQLHVNTSFLGQWKNQYGSQLNIDHVEHGQITGSFASAVDKSIPASPAFGLCTGNLIVINVASSKEGEKIASFTGVLQGDRIETLWHVAVGGKGIWETMLTGADTFYFYHGCAAIYSQSPPLFVAIPPSSPCGDDLLLKKQIAYLCAN